MIEFKKYFLQNIFRFSRDIEAIDNIIPKNIHESLSIGTMILVTIIVISIRTPLFIILVIPVLILYYVIQVSFLYSSLLRNLYQSSHRQNFYLNGVLIAYLWRKTRILRKLICNTHKIHNKKILILKTFLRNTLSIRREKSSKHSADEQRVKLYSLVLLSPSSK